MVAAEYPRLPPNYGFDPASAEQAGPIWLTIPPGSSVEPEAALRAACAVSLGVHAGEVGYAIALDGELIISGTIDQTVAHLLSQVGKIDKAKKGAQHRIRIVWKRQTSECSPTNPGRGHHQLEPLVIVAEQAAGGQAVVVTLSYDSRMIPSLEAGWLLGHIKQTFDSVVIIDSPTAEKLSPSKLLSPCDDELDILTRIGTSSASTSTYPTECTTLHSFVMNSVTHHPDQPALVFDDSVTLTYSQLVRLASHLATHLLNLGTITPGQVIPLCIDKRPEMIIAMLAILLSGCAYVNLEPSWPAGRKETIVQEASEHRLLNPGVALIGGCEEAERWRSWGERWLQHVVDPIEIIEPLLSKIDQLEDVDRSGWPAAKPSDPAYLVYTSGSTGAPKGIVVEHRNVAAFLSNYKGVFGRAVGERVLQFPSYAFDVMVVSIWDTFAVSPALAPNGCPLVRLG